MTLKYVVNNTFYTNINQVLKQEFHISSRLLHKLILSKHVCLNSVPVDTRNGVSINDIITVNLDFEEESEKYCFHKNGFKYYLWRWWFDNFK